MKKQKQKQYGFSVVEILIALVVIGVLAFIGWTFFTRSQRLDPNNPAAVSWSFDGNEWKPSGTPPDCESPLTIGAPMDVKQATGVLLPGQVRGTDFKPHGGLAKDNGTDNKVTIYAVRDGYLYRGSRYNVQENDTQYMFDFIDPCGVMYRLDHLAELSDEFKKYAGQLPEPQLDDSRTHNFNDHPFIKKGTVIATQVGIRPDRNVFFDLGVYDLRQQNAVSKTELYKTDQLRISDKEQSFYAVCWFDLLPEKERAIVKALPGRNGSREGTSDYCTDLINWKSEEDR